MILRDFKNEDAQIIAGWIRSEEELYKWSADRFNKYPLVGDDIIENYAPQIETRRFYPLTATVDNGDVVGHFIIRYPREDDNSSVRFGFVILSPEFRGKGYGKELLRLGIEYVKENLTASRIDLGVFEKQPENTSAPYADMCMIRLSMTVLHLKIFRTTGNVRDASSQRTSLEKHRRKRRLKSSPSSGEL